MFKSRRSPYYSKRRRQSLSPLWIILSIPLSLIILELLTRIFVGIAGKGQQLAEYQGVPPIVSAYRLQFLSENNQPYDGLAWEGNLIAHQHLAGGYQLAGEQKSDFWSINEQGFRDEEPVPLEKPQGEMRIFLLGGSTAFGQWNKSNQATIAHKLEQRLNERVAQQRRSPEKYRPDALPFYRPERVKALAKPPKIREGKYRVINAAVPGYTSGNELAQLALQILPYQPDLIIVLNGYGDLMLPSSEAETEIPKLEDFLNNAPGHFWAYLTQPFQNWLRDTYLVKSVQHWVLNPEPSLAQMSLVVTEDMKSLAEHLPADETELERRVARYFNHQKQMVRLSAGAGIPFVVAVQPEITGRPSDQLLPSESEIIQQLSPDYIQRVKQGYSQLIETSEILEKAFPNNVKTMNFYNLYEDFPNLAFTDTVHLSEEANQEMAKSLYYTVTALPKMQVIPDNL
ncbi:MAG: SGNH/GDSL hydrolase family protein [Oscillatoria sp. PMC 1051.18]|nr:SGNH/GDSL hydrolase family protein [Oscillatoria sp. PMC 1050.18]MEC5028680.1 SGNH/GDSL hydrolase family protein [Oscillatoria sp. PMC 1051.18]